MAITLNNSANITYNHGTQSDAINSNLVSTMLTENYSLEAEKTSYNTNWRPSENLTYIVRVKNTGIEPLYEVSIQDNLGDNTNPLLNYVIGSAKMIRNGIITDIVPTTLNPLTLTVPNTLAPGEVVIFSYIAKTRGDIGNNITEITNVATVTGHEVSISGPVVTVDPSPSISLPKANYADVKVEKSVDKEQVSEGDKLTYTFLLENSGNIEATDIVITDNLPTNFVVETITSETNGVLTTFVPGDYSLSTENELVLPTSVTKTIFVPASTENRVGLTVVTITGNVTV